MKESALQLLKLRFLASTQDGTSPSLNVQIITTPERSCCSEAAMQMLTRSDLPSLPQEPACRAPGALQAGEAIPLCMESSVSHNSRQHLCACLPNHSCASFTFMYQFQFKSQCRPLNLSNNFFFVFSSCRNCCCF